MRTDDNLPLFFLTLRLCVTIFALFRGYYRAQLEWFLGFIVDQFGTGSVANKRTSSSSPKAAESIGGKDSQVNTEAATEKDIVSKLKQASGQSGRASPSLEALELELDHDYLHSSHARRRLESASTLEVKELLMETLLQVSYLIMCYR
jgi:hypothetical protein